MNLRATLLLWAIGSIWGASFLFIRVAIDEVQPLQVVFVRTAAGSIVMWAFLRWRREPLEATPRKVGLAGGLAVLGILLPFFLIAWGELEVASGTAAVLNATMPLFTLLFAAVLLADERLTASRVAGVALGFGGVILLAGEKVEGSGSAVSMAAMVIASASYAIAAIGGRVLVRRWNAMALSTAMVSFAAVYSGAIFLATGDPRLDVSLTAWLAMLTLGVAGTGAAYIAYYTLIDMVSSVRASFVAYIIPVVGVALGAIVLGEAVSWNTIAGGALILAGIAIGTSAVRLHRGRVAAAAP